MSHCVGPGGTAPRTQESGSFGGNMDFNGFTDGATLYLPVIAPGALLYFGDGHALQGDGELNGNAPSKPPWTSNSPATSSTANTCKTVLKTTTDIITMGLDGSY